MFDSSRIPSLDKLLVTTDLVNLNYLEYTTSLFHYGLLNYKKNERFFGKRSTRQSEYLKPLDYKGRKIVFLQDIHIVNTLEINQYDNIDFLALFESAGGLQEIIIAVINLLYYYFSH